MTDFFAIKKDELKISIQVKYSIKYHQQSIKKSKFLILILFQFHNIQNKAKRSPINIPTNKITKFFKNNL
jgi:DNA-directed RNA polymerase alpha subunit